MNLQELEVEVRKRYDQERALIERIRDELNGKEEDRLEEIEEIIEAGIAPVRSRKRKPETKQEVVDRAKAFSQDGIKSLLSIGGNRGVDFLNRSLRGQWAEDAIRDLSGAEFFLIPFGPSEAAMPGHEDHEATVSTYNLITKIEGKRPDLLMFKREIWDNFTQPEKNIIEGIQSRPLDDTSKHLVEHSFCALEVKSSLWMYQKRLDSGGDELSVTLKDEEIDVFSKWQNAFETAILFAQVFFDSAYCMSFTRMIEDIGGLEAARDKKTRKSTYRFPLEDKYRFASVAFPDESEGHIEVMADGKVLPYFEHKPATIENVDFDVLRREIQFYNDC
jgi:hypothetical protein